MTVIAVPIESGKVVGGVTCTDGATCIQTVNYNGACTIVLTGQTSDVTLTFTGVGAG